MVTYNRLSYTKRTLRTLLATIEVPYYLVIVDNNSSDGTQDYLKSLLSRNKVDKIILNEDNYYPGKACNIGWTEGLKDYPQATHLMRLDNDMHFERGWDERAADYFRNIDRMGQLGLDFNGGENKPPQFYSGMWLVEWPGCVGGPNIIRRKIFDDGLRYDESRWEGSRTPVQEDSKFSKEIKNMGWLVGHMDEKYSWTFADESNWKDFPDYYLKTMYDRNYMDNVELLERIKHEQKNDLS